MINPVKTAVKCCGCIVLSQLIGILVSLGVLAAFVLIFYLYVVPWGEDKIRDALHLGSDVDIGSLNASVIAANNCSGCVFGVNTDWPTNTTGTLHFLDTSAGPTASAVIATSLAAGAAAGVGSMLWASFFPSAASVMSFSSGFYEMTHIVEQAQFIGMISQLQIDGAPVFLHQFSREMAWTNFNVPKSITDRFSSTSRRRLESSSLLSTTASGETGPKRYADLIGVSPERLFFYTLLSFAIVVGAIHVLYIIGVAIFSMLSKKESFGEVAAKLYRKVIWACILALLLAQYIFSMAGSYYIYQNADTSDRDSYFVWGTIGLIAIVGFAIVFGVLIISANREELEDIGTYEHDQRPFSAKYGPYYDEYNFDNRFFFVPRILLAVSTGTVVGTVQNATTQLLCILGITMLYLVLLLAREPNLLRFLYYIGITSVFMKVVLVCMMLMLVQDDYFPQSVRDNVAYAIIGVNIFIFFLLFLRQAYTIIHKLIRGCKNKKNARERATSDEVINLENGNEPPRNPPPYSRLDSTASYNNKAAQTPVQNANGVMAANADFTNHQTNQQFGRGNVGNSPYDRFNNETAATAGVAAAGAAYGWNNQDPRNYDARQQNGAQGQVAAGAAGAAGMAARDRNNYGQNDYSNGANAGKKNNVGANNYAAGGASNAAAAGAGRFSATSTSSAPYVAAGAGAATAAVAYNARSPNRAPPPRKGSVDIDGDEMDDVVAPPPAYKQANSAQQASAGAPVAPRNRQSYLAFTDSDMSSYDPDDIDGRSPRSSVSSYATSGGKRAPPTSNTSGYSDFSTDSTATDWFDRRSKTEIEDKEGTLLHAEPYGAAGTAFNQRGSLDSYTTDYDNNSTRHQSMLTANSNASDVTNLSGEFDTEYSDIGVASSVLTFEDDDEEVGRKSGVDQRGSLDSYTTDYGNNSIHKSMLTGSSSIASETTNLSGNFDTEHSDAGVASSVLAFEDDEEVVNAAKSLSSSPELGKSDSIDSYGTEPRDGDAGFNDTFMTVKSSASSVSDEGTDTGRMDTMAAAYLRSAGENESHFENDLGDDDDFDGSSSYGRPDGDSFLSAMSTRSDDDASFYINGQRRNAGESTDAVGNGEKRQSPMKKL